MSISVVIPTHNRYEKLRNLLISIRGHFYDKIESVVVVDDSDEKESLEGFDDIRIQHIMIDHRVFISKAKNIGWRASEGDYVYFIDDDNVIEDTTIPPVIDTISSSSSYGAVMPAVLYSSRPDLVWVYATPFLDRRMSLNLVGRNQVRNPSLENRRLKTDALPNASLVRRTALQDVKGFDERLVVNSSLDFCQRLKASGWQVISDTSALIYHDVEVPGRLGWWAAHGSVDPGRVRYELRDWFLIMKILHEGERLLVFRSAAASLRFVMPNLLAYSLRGRSRIRLVKSILTGYSEGIRLST
jgi:GT2 family glycosyltransferase